jgi:hypothetical protein
MCGVRRRVSNVPSPDSCTATIFGLFDRLSGELRTSPSLTGVRAAALAGLAVTPLPASAVVAGLRILGAEEGLPRLPDLEFAIHEKARPEKAAAALAAALLALARQNLSRSSRPATDGRPGDRSAARVDRLFRTFIATSKAWCCDDRLNPPPAFPHAMVLTVSFALSRAIGLVCHPRLRGVSGPLGLTSPLRKLDASVEASGPHDFSVRKHAPSSEAPFASTASPPASVTIAIRPSCGTGWRRCKFDLGQQ